jgi:hypothetical protein
MNIDELRSYQAHFEARRQHERPLYAMLENLREEFVRRFPIDTLRRMRIDKYVEGKVVDDKVDKSTFCYWVEWKTESLGKMQGARSDKFGVYMAKETQTYRFLRRYPSADDAFQHTKDQILNLIQIGGNAGTDDLEAITLSPMFKGKILFLYYPERYLNIFSAEHVGFFLRRIGLYEVGDGLVHQRASIVEWKNQDEVMANWTMFEFSDFLYTEIGRPPRRGNTPAPLLEHIEFEDEYPRPEDTVVETINLDPTPSNPGDIVGNNLPTRRSRIIDFERRNRNQRRLGELGEQIVLRMEKMFLSENHHDDLAARVEQISTVDSSAGYDVKSYDLDGTEKHIEVKATASAPSGEVTFFLTANEYLLSASLPNYFIYIVFEANTRTPKVWKIENPTRLEGISLHLVPISYKCTITTA